MLTVHKDYPCHVKNYRKGRRQAVRYLVIHYVGATGDARNNAKYYGTTPGIGASAHYFVGHGPRAEVWASVAEGDTAWHCGANRYVHPECRNDNAIGVELCCHKDAAGGWYFDAETVEAAVALCRDIIARYGMDRGHVLRHYDVTGKVCPAPFVHDESAWEAFKDRLFAPAVAVEPTPKVYNTVTECPQWAKPAVQWAVDSGYIQGDERGRLGLDGTKLWALQVMYNIVGRDT